MDRSSFPMFMISTLQHMFSATPHWLHRLKKADTPMTGQSRQSSLMSGQARDGYAIVVFSDLGSWLHGLVSLRDFGRSLLFLFFYDILIVIHINIIITLISIIISIIIAIIIIIIIIIVIIVFVIVILIVTLLLILCDCYCYCSYGDYYFYYYCYCY